ncbi:MAG TPA: uracil-DNA glycosylase [Bacteroidetes bacterium]|nr:uracil-DNA glycosylase [Bacteroidota bacterium]
MNDPANLIQKIERYLGQHEEMYGNVAFEIQETKSELPGSADDTVVDENFDPLFLEYSDDAPTNTNFPESVVMNTPNLDHIKTLAELHELCKVTPELHTDLEGTNLVFGTGNPNADLMVIGEAPGAEEDKRGEPFVGRSGQLLTKILEAINLPRDQVFIANILKHRPPDNRNPLPAERKRSLPYLLKQIDLINPKLILCLGKVSAETLLGKSSSMKDMRGSFHKFSDKYELLVTYHPAALLRNPNWKRDTWDDVKVLRNRYDELGCKP